MPYGIEHAPSRVGGANGGANGVALSGIETDANAWNYWSVDAGIRTHV